MFYQQVPTGKLSRTNIQVSLRSKGENRDRDKNLEILSTNHNMGPYLDADLKTVNKIPFKRVRQLEIQTLAGLFGDIKKSLLIYLGELIGL